MEVVRPMPRDNPNYYDPRGQQRAEPVRDPREEKRHTRAKSEPRTKHKDQTDSKHSKSEKHSKHGSLPRKKDKKSKSETALPEFVPINYVAPRQAPNYNDYPQYNYHTAQHNVPMTAYPSRPRPGVGVMFNPAIGVTDF